MISRAELFIALVALLVVALSTVAIYFITKARRLAKDDWGNILARLKPTNRENLASVALNLVDEDGNLRDASWPELEASEIWELLDGMAGMETLAENCDVLIDLAFYLQTWYPEALTITDQLRRNAREIKWHIERLKGAEQTGNIQSSFAEYGQRAAATYYLMTQRLIELYKVATFPRLAELEGSL